MGFDYDGQRVLLVEGKNDCHLIFALCKYYALPQIFGLNECGSDEKALKKLSALIASSQPKEAIGIVLDADNPSLEGKWASIKRRLLDEGYMVPEKPAFEGSIIRCEGKAVVGVWLMPDNNVDGMLEDFCALLAPSDSLDFAGECVKLARERGFGDCKDAHFSKAKIHTFLAWQNEPGMPVGQAVSAKALNPDGEIAVKFKDFLLSLFVFD